MLLAFVFCPLRSTFSQEESPFSRCRYDLGENDIRQISLQLLHMLEHTVENKMDGLYLNSYRRQTNQQRRHDADMFNVRYCENSYCWEQDLHVL
ncbi:hypothetical protein ABVT39_022148 [Epinephelus coioides]